MNPVLVTDIKPDDRVLYDGWKQQMQELGATEDDTKSDNGANAGSDSKDSPKPVVGWKPKSLGNSEWGAQLTGKSVAELPQDLTGVPIIVTTSKGKSWKAASQMWVSRDEKTVIVRTAEKPKLPDDGPPEPPTTTRRATPIRTPSTTRLTPAGSPSRSTTTNGGAQLTGKSVAELPQDLTGVPIIVTTSKGKSWESRITDVVSRDEKTVIMRTAEKPKLPDDGPPTA